MSLDDRLRTSLIKTARICHRYAYSAVEKEKTNEAVDEAISQIKQAFADEGYVTPENAKKVQEMVNQMVNLANDAIRMPTIHYVKPNLKTMTSQNLMTGQEFYERWKVELAKESLNHQMPMDINAYDLAAERASGLDKPSGEDNG